MGPLKIPQIPISWLQCQFHNSIKRGNTAELQVISDYTVCFDHHLNTVVTSACISSTPNWPQMLEMQKRQDCKKYFKIKEIVIFSELTYYHYHLFKPCTEKKVNSKRISRCLRKDSSFVDWQCATPNWTLLCTKLNELPSVYKLD